MWDKLLTKKDVTRREFLRKSGLIGVGVTATAFSPFVPGIMNSAHASLNSWFHQITVTTPVGFSRFGTVQNASITSGQALLWPTFAQAQHAQNTVRNSISSYNTFYNNLFRYGGSTPDQISGAGQHGYVDRIEGSVFGPTMVPGVKPNWNQVVNIIGDYLNGVGVTTWMGNIGTAGPPNIANPRGNGWLFSTTTNSDGTYTVTMHDTQGDIVTIVDDGGEYGLKFNSTAAANLSSAGFNMTDFVGKSLGVLGNVGFVYLSNIPTAGELPGQPFGPPIYNFTPGFDYYPYDPYGLSGLGIFDSPPILPSIEVIPGSIITPYPYGAGFTLSGVTSNNTVAVITQGQDITSTLLYSSFLDVGGAGFPDIRFASSGATDQLREYI